MNSIYIEYDFTINPNESMASEILIAELSEVGFESFVETDNGLLAYIQQKDEYQGILEDIYILSSPEFTISYTCKEIEPINWNKQWEKNFSPITIDDLCMVRAPFHEKTNTRYDIVIEPKMSFGTGHHETTYMMLQYILEKDLSGKSVLDMGCGTGVLAIASALRGAKDIDAIDIDEWCCKNASENIILNNVDFINVQLGDASLLCERHYDLIIANINRNILLADMESYAKSLNPKGSILLSGFYEDDIPIIIKEAEKNSLELQSKKTRNQWAAIEMKLK